MLNNEDTERTLGGTVSPTQAANILRVSPQRVKQMCETGVLPCVRTPLGRLLKLSDVERLAQERSTGKGVRRDRA